MIVIICTRSDGNTVVISIIHSIHIIFHCLHLREIRGERACLRLLRVQAVPSMDGKEVGLTLRSVVWRLLLEETGASPEGKRNPERDCWARIKTKLQW